MMLLWILCFWTVGVSTSPSPREPDYSRIAGDPMESYICTNNFTSVFTKCVRHFPEPMTRMKAMKVCRRYAGNLLTIRNHDEHSYVKSYLEAEPRKFWLGLYCFNDNVSQCIWDTGNATAQAYKHFPRTFPSMKLGNCVHSQINGDGKEEWLSADCGNAKFEFYCEIPVTFDDFCDLNFNKHCYFPSTIPDSGIQNVRNSCKAFGADLVSIGSREEHLFIKNYYETLNISSIFIGARSWIGRYFKWMDETPFTYNAADRYNIVNQGECMVMNLKSDGDRTEGYWYEEDCSASRHYMCKRKAGQKYRIQNPLKIQQRRHSLRLVSSYMNYGRIESPDYQKGGYGPNVTAVYRLWTLGSQRIRLHILEIQTEEDHDFVKVYDGKSEECELIASLSGKKQDLFFESSSNRMHVVFKTDLQGNDLGFTANFKSIV